MATPDSVSSSLNIVAKPNTTSPVWAYFGLKGDAKNKPVNLDDILCHVCEKVVPTKGSSTTNLFTHLKNHRPIKYSELRQTMDCKEATHSKTIQPTIVQAMDKATKYRRSTKKWQKLTDSVTYCLCKDMMPLYSVEKPGFCKMLQVFDPQYDLPGRKYFLQTAIPLLYDSLREKIVFELREIDHFAATADMWSSHTSTGEPYLTYTIHFINADWKLESRVLQASYLPQDHNAENISDAFTVQP